MIITCEPEAFIVRHTEDPLALIEYAGRTCYQSRSAIGSRPKNEFIQMLIDKGHESVLEHAQVTVQFYCSRAISHELVRHRLASYSQESTRYVNYNKVGMMVIRPHWVNLPCQNDTDHKWVAAMNAAADTYMDLIENHNISPQDARGVLPNDLKTDIVMTANLREWRHILKLRLNSAAHPDMRFLMSKLLPKLQNEIPVVFDEFSVNLVGVKQVKSQRELLLELEEAEVEALRLKNEDKKKE